LYAQNIPQNFLNLFDIIDKHYDYLEKENKHKVESLRIIADDLKKSNELLIAESKRQKYIYLALKEILIILLQYTGKKVDNINGLSMEQMLDSISSMVKEMQSPDDNYLISRGNFDTFTNNIKDIIFQTDGKGRIIYINKAWTDITGYNLDDTMKQTFESFISAPDLNMYEECFNKLSSRERDYCRFQIRLKAKDNTLLWTDIFSRLLFDDE
jgi:PAS domain S-box-containing protein